MLGGINHDYPGKFYILFNTDVYYFELILSNNSYLYLIINNAINKIQVMNYNWNVSSLKVSRIQKDFLNWVKKQKLKGWLDIINMSHCHTCGSLYHSVMLAAEWGGATLSSGLKPIQYGHSWTYMYAVLLLQWLAVGLLQLLGVGAYWMFNVKCMNIVCSSQKINEKKKSFYQFSFYKKLKLINLAQTPHKGYILNAN